MPNTWAAAGIIVLLLALATYIQTTRLDACHARSEADKVLIRDLGLELDTQNAAVEALDAAGKAAKAKGAKAVAQAQKEALGHAGEVARLSGLLKGDQGGGKSCESGVQDAKAGLGAR